MNGCAAPAGLRSAKNQQEIVYQYRNARPGEDTIQFYRYCYEYF